MKAAIFGLPLDPIFSLTALVAALGALALGGFTDLPVVALAAVAIGTLEQGVAWDEPARRPWCWRCSPRWCCSGCSSAR